MGENEILMKISQCATEYLSGVTEQLVTIFEKFFFNTERLS